MDQVAPNPPEIKPSVVIPPSSPVKLITIALGTLILISITLLTLNYFNIIPLSKLYPKQFTWLPHKITQISSTPKNSSQINLPPLKDSINSLLKTYLANVIDQKLIASSSGITTKEDPRNKDSISASWANPSWKIITSLSLSPDHKQLVALNFVLNLPKTATPSAKLAQTLTTNYIKEEPKGTWGCKTIDSITYCENFWTDNNGNKKGMGIRDLLPTNKEKLIVIFFCERTKESESYDWQSCMVQLAQTGVK